MYFRSSRLTSGFLFALSLAQRFGILSTVVPQRSESWKKDVEDLCLAVAIAYSDIARDAKVILTSPENVQRMEVPSTSTST